jgi:hypothetical protein
LSFSLTPDREDELVELVATFIVDNNMVDVAAIMLETFSKSNAVANMGFFQMYPFMTLFFGRTGQELSELIGLNPSVNNKRILERIEELEKERVRKREAEKAMKQLLGIEERSIASMLKTRLSNALSFLRSKQKKESTSTE